MRIIRVPRLNDSGAAIDDETEKNTVILALATSKYCAQRRGFEIRVMFDDCKNPFVFNDGVADGL